MTDQNANGPRHRVVVDCETTGLREGLDVAVEVAWWDQETGERGEFIPPHPTFDMELAEPKALQINGYWSRNLDNPLHWDWAGDGVRRLHAVLAGNTWAGSNPAFDVRMLGPVFDRQVLPRQPHHHRLDALESVARGWLGLRHPIGSAEVCERLGVEPIEHTAAGDVESIGRCFLRIDELPRVVLDPSSTATAEQVARIAMNLPPHQKLKAGELGYGRTILRRLYEEGATQ